MLKTTRPILASLAALLAFGGCNFTTEPSTLENFQWMAVEDQAQVQEGIDAAPFGGDINILGQMRTPSLCYSLEASFDRDGSTLVVHVTAKASNSSNCSQNPGGYLYTAVLRQVGSGSFTVRVIHSVAGVGESEYAKAVTIQ